MLCEKEEKKEKEKKKPPKKKRQKRERKKKADGIKKGWVVCVAGCGLHFLLGCPCGGPIRAMSGKGTSLLPSELTAAKWLAIRPLEFFSPSSSMASFTCAVCSMPYDTSKKRDQCASAHAKAVQGLAAVEGLSGQSLEEMKEEEEKKKK